MEPVFNELGLNSQSYSLERMDVEHVTYIKLHIDQTKSYVGSTKETMVGREASRRRAFNCQDPTRRVEPVFLWWRKTGTYWEFCPVVLEMFDSHSKAIERELAIHDVRKPELVAPYIWKFLPRATKLPRAPACIASSRACTGAMVNSWAKGPPKMWNDPRRKEAWCSICDLSQSGGPAQQRITRLASEGLTYSNRC